MTTNLEYYKVFYYVALTGSLTGAADMLNISQPAVSQTIKQLESGLGVKLVQRVKYGVMLTKEGEVLYSYVKNGYQLFEAAERALKEMLCVDTGEIILGASDMTLEFFLLPYLEKFHEKYPNVKITVTNAPTPETIRNLKNHVIDFGVISTPFDTDESIKAVEVKEISDTFVAARKYIKYKNKTLDFKDLESLPIIALDGNTSTRKYVDTFMKENGVELKPEFELATSDMIVQFALKNLGIGSVMREFASKYIEDGTLFELRFRQMIPKRHFCLVTNENTILSTAAKTLLTYITEGTL